MIERSFGDEAITRMTILAFFDTVGLHLESDTPLLFAGWGHWPVCRTVPFGSAT